MRLMVLYFVQSCVPGTFGRVTNSEISQSSGQIPVFQIVSIILFMVFTVVIVQDLNVDVDVKM